MSDLASQASVLETIYEQLPVRTAPYDAASCRAGLVIVDEINGFATIGAGPLAPTEHNDQVDQMVSETDRLAQLFAKQDRHIALFLDTHEPGKSEPSYPPHCEIGSGQEELVPELDWLQGCPQAMLLRKDCISGYIGAIDNQTGSNLFKTWARDHQLETMIVTGICTDICVMDFVLTVLSARNHGLLPGLKDVVVLESACATYDLPRDKAQSRGLPETASHPQEITHHLGLYFMASRNAIIASRIDIGD